MKKDLAPVFEEFVSGSVVSNTDYTTVQNAGDPRFTQVGPQVEIGALTAIHTIYGNDRYPDHISETLTLLSNALPRKRLAVRIDVNNYISEDCEGSRPAIEFLMYHDQTSFGTKKELEFLTKLDLKRREGGMAAAHPLTIPLLRHFGVTEAEAFVAGKTIQTYGIECPVGMPVLDVLERIKNETSLLEDFSMEDLQTAVARCFLDSEFDRDIFGDDANAPASGTLLGNEWEPG